MCCVPFTLFYQGFFPTDVHQFLIFMSLSYQYFLSGFLPLFRIFQNKIDVAMKEAPSFSRNHGTHGPCYSSSSHQCLGSLDEWAEPGQSFGDGQRKL